MDGGNQEKIGGEEKIWGNGHCQEKTIYKKGYRANCLIIKLLREYYYK